MSLILDALRRKSAGLLMMGALGVVFGDIGMLAIVHRIVADYNGEIQVSSQPGTGTTVSVRLLPMVIFSFEPTVSVRLAPMVMV